MRVAERGYADAAQEIEVVVPLFVAQINALPTDKENRGAFISMEKQFALRRLYGCKLHATMTSVPSLTRVEQRSGSSPAASAGRMRTRLTPCVSARRQAFNFGNMPPKTTCCFSS